MTSPNGQHSLEVGWGYLNHQLDGWGIGLGPRFAPQVDTRLVMQADGNLVLYDGATPKWSTRTYGHPGAWLSVQDDGSFVVRSSTNQTLWAHTFRLSEVTTPVPGSTRLLSGWMMVSPGGTARLVMQTDGNAVVYGAANKPLWSSRTYGHPGAKLLVQSDGNVVVYDIFGRPLWASGTRTAAGKATSLVLRDDGILWINDSVKRRIPLWYAGGYPDRVVAGPTGNGWLAPGRYIASPNGKHRLSMQSDGKLMLSVAGKRTQLAAPGVTGQMELEWTHFINLPAPRTDQVIFRTRSGSGTFVIYSSDWIQGPATLIMQDDGNLVLYAAGKPLWASNTRG